MKQNIKEARIAHCRAQIGGYYQWAVTTDKEAEKINKIIKALTEYEEYLNKLQGEE